MQNHRKNPARPRTSFFGLDFTVIPQDYVFQLRQQAVMVQKAREPLRTRGFSSPKLNASEELLKLKILHTIYRRAKTKNPLTDKLSNFVGDIARFEQNVLPLYDFGPALHFNVYGFLEKATLFDRVTAVHHRLVFAAFCQDHEETKNAEAAHRQNMDVLYKAILSSPLYDTPDILISMFQAHLETSLALRDQVGLCGLKSKRCDHRAVRELDGTGALSALGYMSDAKRLPLSYSWQIGDLLHRLIPTYLQELYERENYEECGKVLAATLLSFPRPYLVFGTRNQCLEIISQITTASEGRVSGETADALRTSIVMNDILRPYSHKLLPRPGYAS